MEFRTKVSIPAAPFQIDPTDELLFVGSCFADNMGARFTGNRFRTIVNPFGVMYNPASVLHTIERCSLPAGKRVGVITLGTNHVYILKETGEIVDNCQKRPQRLFDERELTIDECAGYLIKAVALLREANPDTRVIFTVSPIRYAKYGYHESQLSKATLLLAIDKVIRDDNTTRGIATSDTLYYFPAYEILNDELRDYRFYAPDMLHPSAQAVDYIYERFAETLFSPRAHAFVKEWQPIKAALSHRPFNPESAEYQTFLAKAKADEQAFVERWRV